MQRSSLVLCAALTLAVLPAHAADTLTSSDRWEANSEILTCVKDRLKTFLSDFDDNAGTTCPEQCANCFTAPLTCLASCDKKEAACGCTQAIPQGMTSLSSCCELLSWEILQSPCQKAIEGLGETMVNLIGNSCEEGDASFIVKTHKAAVEGATAVIAGLQMGGQHRSLPGSQPGALLNVDIAEVTGKQAEGDYVSSHNSGGACLTLMETIENQHAESHADALPNLLEAAQQIKNGAESILGRALPGLENAVHKAMALAWSDEGPGVDSHDLCEMILKHHDGL